MLNIVGVESGRQLISNLSSQSSDILLTSNSGGLLLFNNSTFAISLLVLGLILGLILGRRRVVSAIISVYIVTALGVFLPISQLFSQEKNTSFIILVSIFFVLVIFFALPGHFSGSGFCYYNRFWMFIFGIVLVSLIVLFMFQFAPNSWLSFFPSLAIKVFTSTWYKFSATLLPLVILWLVAKNNIE